MAAKWINVELTASSEVGSGNWIEVSRLRNITATISNSTAASVPSCVLELQGTNDILGSTAGAGREGFTRLGSTALTTTADMSTLILSNIQAGAGRTDLVNYKYMRLRISAFTQGSPKIILRAALDQDDSA